MGDFKMGSDTIDNIMMGSEQVLKIYQGTEIIWSNTTTVPVIYSFVNDAEGWTGGFVWDSEGGNNPGGHQGEGGGLILDISTSSVLTSPNIAYNNSDYIIKLDMYVDSNSGQGGVNYITVVWDGEEHTQNTIGSDIWETHTFIFVQDHIDSSPLVITINKGGDHGDIKIDNINNTLGGN